MRTIQEIIEELQVSYTQVEIGNILGVSNSMVSRYKKEYLASLEVAKRWYKRTGEAIHPFAEESLLKELENE